MTPEHMVELADEIEKADAKRSGTTVSFLCNANAPAIIAALRLAAQQDGAWQPIETAPKDTPVNIFVPVNRPERRVLSAYQDDAGWTILSGSIVIGKPTHWRPLPAGPEQTRST